mgnify:CR=1 FL=1|tara:strand:- start:1817 stop:2029 length:213 start_codon:yes stop_codon:yes gene_type:complete
MKTFVVVISIWGNNGTDWVYTGNQYVMNEMFTKEQCEQIIDSSNWNDFRENPYYDLQFDCFNEDDINGRR